ncbi:MAG: hypothetical protein ACE5HZ_07425 [Fidelibacterota bacterium]
MRKLTAVVLVAFFGAVPREHLDLADTCEIPCCRLIDPQCTTEEANPGCPTLMGRRQVTLFVVSATEAGSSTRFSNQPSSGWVATTEFDASRGFRSRSNPASKSPATNYKVPLYFQHHRLLI